MFSSEFVATKTCMEHIVAVKYKLRIFRVSIDGPVDVLCENQSVVLNFSLNDSALNKKQNRLEHHATRWLVVARVLSASKVNNNDNIVSAFTKQLTDIQRTHLFY